MNRKLYLGYFKASKSEIFRCAFTPTFDSHGDKYVYSVGPFYTKKGAEFMRDYGYLNPHCQTVAQAERLSRELKVDASNLFGELDGVY